MGMESVLNEQIDDVFKWNVQYDYKERWRFERYVPAHEKNEDT